MIETKHYNIFALIKSYPAEASKPSEVGTLPPTEKTLSEVIIGIEQTFNYEDFKNRLDALSFLLLFSIKDSN